MIIHLSYKNKAYKIDLPSTWAECSDKQINLILKLFLVTETELVDGINTFLRKAYKVPKKAVAKLYRHDLIINQLAFIDNEELILKKCYPKRVMYAKSPSVNLSNMTVRDYMYAQMLVSQITSTLKDEKTFPKKHLRLLAGILYRTRKGKLNRKDRLWTSLTRIISDRKLYYAYLTFTGCMRHVREIYPTMHGGGSTDQEQPPMVTQDVHRMLNNMSGAQFGTRRQVETYTIHEVFPYLEDLAEKAQKAERQAALRKLNSHR